MALRAIQGHACGTKIMSARNGIRISLDFQKLRQAKRVRPVGRTSRGGGGHTHEPEGPSTGAAGGWVGCPRPGVRNASTLLKCGAYGPAP